MACADLNTDTLGEDRFGSQAAVRLLIKSGPVLL